MQIIIAELLELKWSFLDKMFNFDVVDKKKHDS